MTARKHRYYIVDIDNVSHLVRATTPGQAVTQLSKDLIRVRVAEADDLIRLARAGGATIRVANEASAEPEPAADEPAAEAA